MNAPARLSIQGFLALLFIACIMGANHVAARVALDHGANVVTAVFSRSAFTALVVATLVWWTRAALVMTARQRRLMLAMGLLIAAQSVLLYSAVARIPVGLALLAFNLYPLCAAVWSALLYRQRPPARVLWIIPVILFGLGLALDVASALGMSSTQAEGSLAWGVGLAVAAAVVFGVVLAITQHEVASVDGRWRTTLSMAMVGSLALILSPALGGLQWPTDATGWWGLGALSSLYGLGITLLFVILPRLGVVSNSPVLNVEPIAALLMAWGVLGQAMRPVQWVGAGVVVAGVMALGLKRH